MKKFIIYILTALTVFGAYALGAYKVEIDDDEFVSDEVFFAPNSTWYEVEAEKINLKEGKITFYEGKEYSQGKKISATVMPVNTTDKKISYKSEDESIARVSEDGTVFPTGKVGETIIDVRCDRAMAKVKVQTVNAVTGVELSQTKMTLYADKPVTAQLTATVLPADATVRTVVWYSEDESIAYVDGEGLVRPCGVGETRVYARTEDGGFTAACEVTVTTWEKRGADIPSEYTEYDITLEEMVEIQMAAEPTVFTNGVYPASAESVEQYVNPDNLTSGYERYQFMDLSMSNGVSADMLNAYLNGKGILSGMGKTFKNAADNNGISEVYLVIHACLESGNGSSELANGIEYEGETVYNLFGIGAVDSAPAESGARYAYEQGWTSPEAAAEGGAEWISENYINNSRYMQNTLYKMRWNPGNPGTHQYATDIAWASKQAKSMSAMFEAFPTAEYRFEIPAFKAAE